MRTKERREEILKILRGSQEPVKGSELAERMQVTRQIIVNDINVLRAYGLSIRSTSRGYQMKKEAPVTGLTRRIICAGAASENDTVWQELNAVVDNGGHIQEIQAHSPDFGTVTISLELRCRRDVRKYLEKVYHTEKGTSVARMLRREHTLLVKAHCSGEFDDMVENLKALHAFCRMKQWPEEEA